MEPVLVQQYVAPGQVRFEYRDDACRGPEAELAARAASGGEEQGKFWEMHATIFANQRGGDTPP